MDKHKARRGGEREEEATVECGNALGLLLEDVDVTSAPLTDVQFCVNHSVSLGFFSHTQSWGGGVSEGVSLDDF